MIQIEFLKSPDKDILSTFQFFQNQIYLGRTFGTFLIKDPDLYKTHLMIEVVGNDLLVHPQTDVEFYLIDGKRSSTVRKIKRGQIITIEKTNFKVLNFEETHFETKKNILDQKLSHLIETNSGRVEIIEKLSIMMK